MKKVITVIAVSLLLISAEASAAYPWLDSNTTFINTIEVAGGTNSGVIRGTNANCWKTKCWD